jgi:hypothetical protein
MDDRKKGKFNKDCFGRLRLSNKICLQRRPQTSIGPARNGPVGAQKCKIMEIQLWRALRSMGSRTRPKQLWIRSARVGPVSRTLVPGLLSSVARRSSPRSVRDYRLMPGWVNWRMSYPSRFGILARKERQIFVVPAKAGTQNLPPCFRQGQALAGPGRWPNE